MRQSLTLQISVEVHYVPWGNVSTRSPVRVGVADIAWPDGAYELQRRCKVHRRACLKLERVVSARGVDPIHAHTDHTLANPLPSFPAAGRCPLLRTVILPAGRHVVVLRGERRPTHADPTRVCPLRRHTHMQQVHACMHARMHAVQGWLVAGLVHTHAVNAVQGSAGHGMVSLPCLLMAIIGHATCAAHRFGMLCDDTRYTRLTCSPYAPCTPWSCAIMKASGC